MVDSVAEVLRISPADIQPPPERLQGDRAQECILGVINNRERLLVVLDRDAFWWNGTMTIKRPTPKP